jgi:hypothetical protein
MTRTGFAAFLAATLLLSPAALGASGDLASALHFDHSRPRLDPRAKELVVELTLTNVSTASVSGPFRVILEDLRSVSSAKSRGPNELAALDADGERAGAPYFDFAAATLAPGETATREARFANSRAFGLPFRWTATITRAGPPSFDGTYASSQTLGDGYFHKEVARVAGSEATGHHTFNNGGTAGSFSWNATISSTRTLSGEVHISNFGERDVELTGGVYFDANGIATLWWSATDPAPWGDSPIGWSEKRIPDPRPWDGAYTYSETFADGWHHTETAFVTGLTATGYHTFKHPNGGFGSFTFEATITPQGDTAGSLSGTVTIHNLGTRTAPLAGNVAVDPAGTASLGWQATDPPSEGGFGGIGWQTFREAFPP